MQPLPKARIVIIIFLFLLGVCGTVAVVDGTYGYHHYMQDNFNDDVSTVLVLLPLLVLSN